MARIEVRHRDNIGLFLGWINWPAGGCAGAEFKILLPLDPGPADTERVKSIVLEPRRVRERGREWLVAVARPQDVAYLPCLSGFESGRCTPGPDGDHAGEKQAEVDSLRLKVARLWVTAEKLLVSYHANSSHANPSNGACPFGLCPETRKVLDATEWEAERIRLEALHEAMKAMLAAGDP